MIFHHSILNSFPILSLFPFLAQQFTFNRICIMFGYHQLTRTHTVLTGRKTPMLLQSPCQYTKYCLRAFHCLNAFLLRQNCCAPDSDGFLCDFWFLSRRRADARQGEKDKKHPAHSMQSPAKWVCMEKEEGDCLVQLLPQGGSGTAQASSDVVRRVCSCQLMVPCVTITVA